MTLVRVRTAWTHKVLWNRMWKRCKRVAAPKEAWSVEGLPGVYALETPSWKLRPLTGKVAHA